MRVPVKSINLYIYEPKNLISKFPKGLGRAKNGYNEPDARIVSSIIPNLEKL